jgi:hypothetical protein
MYIVHFTLEVTVPRWPELIKLILIDLKMLFKIILLHGKTFPNKHAVLTMSTDPLAQDQLNFV